jgi:hypothetical protein
MYENRVVKATNFFIFKITNYVQTKAVFVYISYR